MTLNALEVVARAVARPVVRASMPAVPLDFEDWVGMLSLDGVPYLSTTLKPDQEDVDGGFLSLVQGAYRSNGIVFACLMTRYLLFSEVRFAYQQMRSSRPGNLFGTPALSLLETPGPGRTTGDLTRRMMLDNDLAGIWFGVLMGGAIKRLRPDWTSAVFGSKRKGATPHDPDSELVGFAYQPGGPGSSAEIMSFLPSEVSYFSTTPDAIRNYVGMPWLTSVLKDLLSDSAATIHKLAYFRNAATPNLTVTLPPTVSKTKAMEWIELFEQDHRGAFNAFKTIYFGGGATAEKIGNSLAEIDYRNVTAAGETRIAMAAGVHPVILGASEGMQGSALNAGNVAALIRLFGNKTMRPAWRDAAGSLEHLVGKPSPAVRLWYDARDVPFLQDDVRDSARATQLQGSTIGGLINNGYKPDAATDAVTANDLTRLIGQHTGRVSVQLQEPGAGEPTGPPAGGSGATPAEPPAARRALVSIDAGPYAAAIESARAAIGAGETVAARGAFWPADGPFADLGEIPKGAQLESDHALVRMFPSMFEPVTNAVLGRGGVRCPNGACGKLVAVRLGPGSVVLCRSCKTKVVA